MFTKETASRTVFLVTTAYYPSPRTVGSGMTPSLLPTAISRSSPSHRVAETGYCKVPPSPTHWYLLLPMTSTHGRDPPKSTIILGGLDIYLNDLSDLLSSHLLDLSSYFFMHVTSFLHSLHPILDFVLSRSDSTSGIRLLPSSLTSLQPKWMFTLQCGDLFHHTVKPPPARHLDGVSILLACRPKAVPSPMRSCGGCPFLLFPGITLTLFLSSPVAAFNDSVQYIFF